ncbi:MAG TPA: pilus assembly PilX N-terminal domain-containing protein [Methylomirabilota bacterium]|nr:pilus assembly PilX N-terminal domain-containing protein [Methylomirabilota bacterium]
MIVRQLADTIKDQRGVALPMAMLTLVIMTVLIIAFAVMSSSEPTIANNQLMVSQARAIAEAGMERAIWALNNPGDADGIPEPLILAPAPYNGVPLVAVAYNGTNIGGFRVTVTNGAAANERNISADGWVPNDTAGNRGKQRITVTVSKIRFLDPPAGLAVRGELDIGGNSNIDSRADTSCGNKVGTMSLGATTITSGAADVWGADGNNVRNQATDALQNVPDATFDAFTYSNDELSMLKALAQANGTYYQGTVNFNAGNRLPNGIVYIDTVSGQNIDQNGAGTTPMSDFANVNINGNAPADASGIFSGWLIVAGTLSISGNFEMHGMVYVLNDMSYTGTGTGRIDGAVITQNVRDTSSTSIDTNMGGNSGIFFNCNYAKTGGGQVPQGYRIKTGTYREVSG